jgi:hypothetical protein
MTNQLVMHTSEIRHLFCIYFIQMIQLEVTLMKGLGAIQANAIINPLQKQHIPDAAPQWWNGFYVTDSKFGR